MPQLALVPLCFPESSRVKQRDRTHQWAILRDGSSSSDGKSRRRSARGVGRPLEARLAKQGRELAQVSARLARYETALKDSNVTVLSQDKSLRYTFASNPLFGWKSDEIIGHTDAEVLPPRGRDEVIALKRAVLASGEGFAREVALGDESALRWFDLHIEPLRGEDGAIMGLSCAAIEITERKENEAHLRLLMRELTHRSKNLLAVIQAMARQSERFAGSTASFLEQFNARLHALAASHDLLVRGSWHGASLEALIRSQLGHHLQGTHPPVSLSGPEIVLTPEAAQSLGLAFHELATNAVKYGALSVAAGHVNLIWHLVSDADARGVEVVWTERGGPPAKPPSRRGFGTLVIDHNLARSLDATVTLSYEPAGLVCRIFIPFTQILAGG